VVVIKKMNDEAMVDLGYLSPWAKVVTITVTIILNLDSSHEVAFISIASSSIACSYFKDGLDFLKHHTKVINSFS
jgi:hypothetical protein